MNHITRLQRENRRLQWALATARKNVWHLRQYVLSDKFSTWAYVNTQDIVNRCDHVQSEIDFHEALCASCGLAPAAKDMICTNCADAIEYGKWVREAEVA